MNILLAVHHITGRAPRYPAREEDLSRALDFHRIGAVKVPGFTIVSQDREQRGQDIHRTDRVMDLCARGDAIRASHGPHNSQHLIKTDALVPVLAMFTKTFSMVTHNAQYRVFCQAQCLKPVIQGLEKAVRVGDDLFVSIKGFLGRFAVPGRHFIGIMCGRQEQGGAEWLAGTFPDPVGHRIDHAEFIGR